MNRFCKFSKFFNLLLIFTILNVIKSAVFNKKDFIQLEYDHAPDRDDAHSAAADRSMLQTIFGIGWLKRHVAAVSGAYGTGNVQHFNPDSDAVMVAVWDEEDGPGWLKAHPWNVNLDRVVNLLTEIWMYHINKGNHVWVKEGGQADIASRIVKKIKTDFPNVITTEKIHVVQHSVWNENQANQDDLTYVKTNTDYMKIDDGNAYLNVNGGNDLFEQSALAHPIFGSMWEAAFEYYNPNNILDFSDTCELMHIFGLGKMGYTVFRQNYLDYDCDPTCNLNQYCSQSECVCIEGWIGDDCEIPQCTSGLCNENEYCYAPETCICKTGWTGYSCDVCPGGDCDAMTAGQIIGIVSGSIFAVIIICIIMVIVLLIWIQKRKKLKLDPLCKIEIDETISISSSSMDD